MHVVQLSPMNHPLPQQKSTYNFRYKCFRSDRARIQTWNLLIRSQILYSVELRSHCFNALQK